MKFRNYLNEGKLSQADVLKLAKKHGGSWDQKQDRGKPWVYFIFNESGYSHSDLGPKTKKFIDELQKNHMTLKVEKILDPYSRSVDYFRIKVWF